MSRPKKLSDSELLHIAYDVGSREGFDSFTLRQVARSADLTPAALIKRFKSKRRLVSLARRHRWSTTLDKFQTPVLPNHPATDLRGLNGVRHFVSLIAQSVDSKRLAEHARAFGMEARNRRDKSEVAGYFAATRAVFTRLIREACTNGEIVGVQDAEQFAFTLEALIQGGIFQFAFLSERSIEPHLQDHVQRYLQPYLCNAPSSLPA